ncbi:MAG: hypothetical protein HQM16_01825 [Deltaproteobacteria bacterium]|nr:hypothetical protein [Deltaproteobacteria bacterium]
MKVTNSPKVTNTAAETGYAPTPVQEAPIPQVIKEMKDWQKQQDLSSLLEGKMYAVAEGHTDIHTNSTRCGGECHIDIHKDNHTDKTSDKGAHTNVGPKPPKPPKEPTPKG